jgi:4-diphosphocytidyl-2-C-methyl-D-erythritol kinase
MFELKSYAKINLGLEIVGKRNDGYHNLKTVFQTINLFDTIEIHENPSGKIRLHGDHPTVEWDHRNTISRAIDTLYNNYHVRQGFDIVVKKKIPPGSGLGGGSSNAAVILLFLNNYFNLDIQREDLINLAARIGADVPFFLIGGTVLAEGIGEKMTPLEDSAEKQVDIVIPPITVPTALIFSHLNLTSTPGKSKIDTFIKSKNIKILENNLEKVTFERFPEVEIIKNKMSTMGYELVLMSGSGSAVYGITGTTGTAEARTASPESETGQRISRLKELFPGARVIAAGTLNRQNYLKGIGASPSGKASVFGADIRRFESFRPSK